MKPLNELLSSLCSTAGVEYREYKGDHLSIPAENGAGWRAAASLVHFCEIVKDGKVIAQGFASPSKPNYGIGETTKETAREWLLYSLITKAINQ